MSTSESVNVWTRFSRVLNEKELKFRIQKISKEHLGQVFKLLFDYFVKEEPAHKASRIAKNDLAFYEYKIGANIWCQKPNYQIDACCLDDGSGDLKIVAVSAMTLERKYEESLDETEIATQAQSAEMKTFINIIQTMDEACDPMKKYNLDSFFDDKGIIVHPDYRGLGIAGEIFKAREVACRKLRVPMAGAWMTSLGTQKAAAKLGWKTICELSYKDLEQKHGVTFEGVPETMKCMIFKA